MYLCLLYVECSMYGMLHAAYVHISVCICIYACKLSRIQTHMHTDSCVLMQLLLFLSPLCYRLAQDFLLQLCSNVKGPSSFCRAVTAQPICTLQSLQTSAVSFPQISLALAPVELDMYAREAACLRVPEDSLQCTADGSNSQ